LASSRETLVEEGVATANILSPGSMKAYALVKEQVVADAVEYDATKGEKVMAKVMDTLFSDEGWTHLQNTLKAMQKKK
jgi:hypothetical protein